MPLYTQLPEALGEFDVIIAGGGAAGCVVAGRLAEADCNLSILLIEGGPNNYNVPSVIYPALMGTNLAPGTTTALFYQAKQTPQLARGPVIVAGGTLGGGSSINFMNYTRPVRCDFDSWRAPGWSAEEVIPFLKRLETYHGKGEPEVHGYAGPVQISDGGFRADRSLNDFVEAAGKVGYPEVKDLQDLESSNGTQRWLSYISPEGRRQDSAHTYLHPLLQDGKHPNLHVLVESQVIRVLLDDSKTAYGVEFTKNPAYMPAATSHVESHAMPNSPKKVAIARKQVVISCGSCSTPGVLERSGIGATDVLHRAGVPIAAEVPGVGRNYQDHPSIECSYKVALGPRDISPSFGGPFDLEKALQDKDPILGWNGIDVASKLRPSEQEVASLDTAFQQAWQKDFKNAPTRSSLLIFLGNGYIGDPTVLGPGQYVTICDFVLYPYSRGSVHITGPDVHDPLNFDVGFFTDREDIDLKTQIWGYKKQREIMRRTGMFLGEVQEKHPSFAPSSDARCGIETSRSKNGEELQDILYTPEDDKAIEDYIRGNTVSVWHSLGTAKMAPLDEMGVVDASLNVHGVKGLKVIDLSIVPEMVGANTYGTALMIGEKGADIIAKELGLSYF